MKCRIVRVVATVLLVVPLRLLNLSGAQTVEYPYMGVTLIRRTETVPRTLNMKIVLIDLTATGIRFKLTPSGGTREAVRMTTLAFLNQQHAQLAINGHPFLPFPSADLNAFLIGLAASDGSVYSAFEAPVQSYTIVTNAPGLNIDFLNQVSIVHINPSFPDGKHVLEFVTLWNTVAGTAQIITDGVKTIPVYKDAQNPNGLLTPGGPGNYSNSNSWYNLLNARTAIGFTQDQQTLVFFTVDIAGGSGGMRVGEVADLLINDYGVYHAVNLDGGGSTTLAMEDSATHLGKLVNVSSDNPNGRAIGSNLAVFAVPDAVPPVTTATTIPSANDAGWNKTDVSVILNALDKPGSGVKQIQYALAGAQTGGPVVVPGNAASFSINTEGTTDVSYFATDNPGNQEGTKTLSIRIDRTLPVISGMPAITGTAGKNGWYRSDVTATWTVADPESSITSSNGCGPKTLTMESAGTELTCTATNAAGLTNSAAVTIKIDKTAPTVAPPTSITIASTQSDGAAATGSAVLSGFLSGGSAVDTLDPTPLRLSAQVSGIDVTSATLFPLGLTTVTFHFRDSADNIGSATATVTVVKGQPGIGGTITGKGVDAGGQYYVDLQLKNTGTGNARDLILTQLSLRTLSGTGTVTLQATPLPLQLGSLDVNSATTVRIYLNRPPTVTRFSITENGTVQDVTGTTYSISIAQSVIA